MNTIFNLRSPNKEEFQLSARKTAIVSATFMTAVVKRSHMCTSKIVNLILRLRFVRETVAWHLSFTYSGYEVNDSSFCLSMPRMTWQNSLIRQHCSLDLSATSSAGIILMCSLANVKTSKYGRKKESSFSALAQTHSFSKSLMVICKQLVFLLSFKSFAT